MSSDPITDITMPDYIAAIVTYLREQPALTDICPAENISPRMPVVYDETGKQLAPRNYVVVSGAPGYHHRYLPIMIPHFSIRTYGTTGFNAMNIWRACHSVLMPPDPSVQVSSFQRLGCQIYSIALVNSPITMVEGRWESRFTIYSAHVWEDTFD